jgi:hypothetical protein
VSYVLGLVSGLVISVVAGLLGIRGQQLSQIRDRQIAGADDFAGVASDVLVSLGARMEAIGQPQGREEEWLRQFREAATEAREATHETTRRLARIELLYGRETEASKAAITTVVHLLRMTEELRKDNGDVSVVEAEHEAASKSLGGFATRAHKIFTRPAWHSWLGAGSGAAPASASANSDGGTPSAT